MDNFNLLAYTILALIIALLGSWGFRSYKAKHWARLTIAVLLIAIFGLGWQFFPILVFLIAAPIFGLAFS